MSLFCLLFHHHYQDSDTPYIFSAVSSSDFLSMGVNDAASKKIFAHLKRTNIVDVHGRVNSKNFEAIQKDPKSLDLESLDLGLDPEALNELKLLIKLKLEKTTDTKPFYEVLKVGTQDGSLSQLGPFINSNSHEIRKILSNAIIKRDDLTKWDDITPMLNQLAKHPQLISEILLDVLQHENTVGSGVDDTILQKMKTILVNTLGSNDFLTDPGINRQEVFSDIMDQLTAHASKAHLPNIQKTLEIGRAHV